MSIEFEPVETFGDLDAQTLVQMVVEAIHRTLVHHGMWFTETIHQVGLHKAVQLERQAFDRGVSIQMKRLGRILGFEVEDGAPRSLGNLSKEKLLDLLRGLAANWLVNDGVWFQAIEEGCDLFTAKRCNDTTWTRYSPFEAARIKPLLGLPEQGGLLALRKALSFRMYALINEQTSEWVDENTLIFKMVDCRVQSARKRKGLEDYPCKSAGLVEYTTFASGIDSRIRTHCIGCPPDPHPNDWYCAWKFTLPTSEG